MKLNVDLREFKKLVDENVSERLNQFSVSLDSLNFERLDELREVPQFVNDFDLDISLNGKLLSYDGHGVIVYIKEQKNLELAIKNPLEEATKYHLTNCSVLEEKKKEKRFGRFVALRYLEGEMPVCDGTGEPDKKASLIVCGACLSKLHYRPYTEAKTSDARKRVQRNFSLSEFLKQQHNFPEECLPLRHAEFSSFGYTYDWKSVSEAYKLSRSYCCDECGVQLSEWKELLHTHHIDGVKSNNHPANLMALCVECHSKQPMHSHLMPKAGVLRYLKEKRLV